MASLIFQRSYQSVTSYRDTCTKDTCPLSLSYWGYLPSLAANSVFLALFSLSLVLFIGQSLFSKRFLGFTIAMVSGCILEVIGYVGRVMSWKNPFSQNAYLIQIICLTIAPAFLAAGIYLCLSRIVLTIGAENSRIKPLSYPRIFIPCDVISLLLQAAGGGLASAQSHANESPDLGDNIMVAGLAFQVLTLLIFMVLATDFAIRTAKRYKAMDEDAFDASHAALRQSFRFRGFVVALAFATLCIFTRSVYRVAELSEGWTGYLIETQRYFIGLEGAIVSAAVLALNAFHPGFCFRDGDTARKAFGFGKKRTDEQNSLGEKVTDRDGEGESGESSDAEGLRPQPVDKQVGEI